MEDSELECRVCRGGPDLPQRPLFSPCLCTGSIGLVHQDCLEQWLEHSRKESCELCGAKYVFDPEYSADAPEVIPLHVLVFSGFKKLFMDVIPFIFRLCLAVFLWLVIAPLCTSWIYRIWFRNRILSEPMRLEAFFSKASLFRDATTGLVLMGVIATSFIVLVRLIVFFPRSSRAYKFAWSFARLLGHFIVVYELTLVSIESK
jgi:E3 ubiquitin-protein ligase MARCH6